jgi:cyclophilin family peptidyl-prolyl cis-trans isomerase
MQKYLGNTLKNSILVASLCLAGLVTACGGGSSGTTTPPAASAATITSVTPPAVLMYNKTATFTVTGQNLDKGITATAPNCNNISVLAGATSTQVLFTCVPAATGALAVSLAATNGATQVSISPTVPQPQVTMKTSLGDMVIELTPSAAPLTVNNFLQYVTDGFYTNKIFHRVISNFVIQGGGFDSALVQASTRAAIKLESGKTLLNVRGSIAMARTNVADSATSQFFINVVDNPSLNATTAGVDGYAVFGKVVTGLPVVDLIKVVPTKTVSPFSDVPVTPIIITSVTQTQ